MKGTKPVACPACGALNRPTWEFCARCGESLEAATLVEGPSAGDVEADGSIVASSAPANAIAFAGLLALALVGFAAWRTLSGQPAPVTVPAAFTIGTQPPEMPRPSPPSGGEASYGAGRRALNAGDLESAVSLLAAATAADPENAEYQNAYGHALWRSGDREGALAAHAEAARLDPRLQMQYARSLDVAGRTAEAAAQYRQLLDQNPSAATVHEDLGRLLFRSGDYKGAAAHLRSAVVSRPEDPVLQQELAYSLDQAGERRQAEAAYRAVLEKAPGAVISRTLLADNLLDQGRKDEALAVLRDGMSGSEPPALLQRQLGSAYERVGRPQDAAAAYRAYAALVPNAADAEELLARATRLEGGGRE